jgi:SNF2 family DNA or RNA helicase
MKICDHPKLLHGEKTEECLVDLIKCDKFESAKLDVLMAITKRVIKTGHRTLIFAESKKILDMISQLLTINSIKHFQIDGSVSCPEDRRRFIEDFNRDESYKVFLMTTKIAVGITLTGADRVIIYNPSWNPSNVLLVCFYERFRMARQLTELIESGKQRMFMFIDWFRVVPSKRRNTGTRSENVSWRIWL